MQQRTAIGARPVRQGGACFAPFGARPAPRAPRAAPLGSTVSLDEIELPEGFVLPKMSSKEGKVLHPDMINPNIARTQYAVRGELYLKAEQMRRDGRDVIFTNIGNPHNLGAPPITFTRQVVALCAAPWLLDDPRTAASGLFPPDTVERARRLLRVFTGGIGAYQDSRGNAAVRADVAAFIERRDGHPTDPEHIYLTDGASPAVRIALNALLRDGDDAVLVPIPQYPLYSAAIAMFGGTLIPYSLDESDGWALSADSLRAAVKAARAAGKCPRALVVINPGNPTGQCLPLRNLREIVQLAHDEKLLIMADEVYQELVYDEDKPFISVRKALLDMGEPWSSAVELFSFHSISKGTSGECGLRGGYFEMTNIHPGTLQQLYKISSINLSPNSVGQVALSCMVNPPKEGDPSYALWRQERDSEFESLRRRARMVAEGFNSLPNITCNATNGAMYCFPRLLLPPKAVAAAKAAGKAPDAFYCLRLLDESGIVTIPGSGFGQQEGSFHLRTTILPREDRMAEFVDKFRAFHTKFMAQYA